MTDTTAPRTAAGKRLNDDLGFHAFLDGTYIEDRIAAIEAEAIEPLLALVRAADVLAECIGIDDYYETVSWPVDANGNSSSDEADRAAHVFAETLRALPESVRVAARKPE